MVVRGQMNRWIDIELHAHLLRVAHEPLRSLHVAHAWLPLDMRRRSLREVLVARARWSYLHDLQREPEPNPYDAAIESMTEFDAAWKGLNDIFQRQTR